MILKESIDICLACNKMQVFPETIVTDIIVETLYFFLFKCPSLKHPPKKSLKLSINSFCEELKTNYILFLNGAAA